MGFNSGFKGLISKCSQLPALSFATLILRHLLQNIFLISILILYYLHLYGSLIRIPHNFSYQFAYTKEIWNS